MKKTIILGVSGGIAAVKIPELVKNFQQNEINIEVVLTHAAAKIIQPPELEKELHKRVYLNLFENTIDTNKILKERNVEHIGLADKASAIVIAPATANIIAKLANGIADDYLTTIVLASQCEIIICPSMNVHMWHHPATQKNIQTLRNLGYQIIDPDCGLLACGYEGQGRLADVKVITEETIKILKKSDTLKGKRILITSGGTKEPIDDVRFLSNRSSGKMGAALSDALFLQGADVTLIKSVSSTDPQYHVPTQEFETADDLENILKKEVKNADILFHVAAVSDFSLKKFAGKIPSEKNMSLNLAPREKIINKIKKWNKAILLIAFKAEANSLEEDLIKKSRDKLKESNADFIIANDIGKKDQGFESDMNEVFVVSEKEAVKVPLASKREVAKKIIDLIFS